MSISDRLDEIGARCDAATDGPWTWASHRTVDGDAWAVFDPHDWAMASNRDGWAPDAEFIAASRTDVPALVAALRAVLDLHQAVPLYDLAEFCEAGGEGHAEERHFETIDGEWVCEDARWGTACAECSEGRDETIDWPCPTVRAVTAVLKEEA